MHFCSLEARPAKSGGRIRAHRSVIDPSVIFAAIAFVMVLLAENARIPIDNPATHLELTMIHEAMVLEYSARHLALVEWASSLKLFNYACIGFALFLPWGIATHGADGGGALLIAVAALIVKARDCRSGAGAHRIFVGQAAHLSRSGISGDGISARRARLACSSSVGSLNQRCIHLI